MFAKYSTVLAAAILACGALVGCSEHKAKPSQAEQTATAEPAHDNAQPGPMSHAPQAAPGGGAGESAWNALYQMDSRKPVPLIPMMANHQKQNMRGHLEAVQQIIAALAKNDYDGVKKAAKRIGSSPQMAQMCTHMGAGAPGFTPQALAFHKTADGIIAAADTHDSQKVMQALGTTLATCTSCHATYKQHVVTPQVWQKKTGMGAPNHMMHGH